MDAQQTSRFSAQSPASEEKSADPDAAKWTLVSRLSGSLAAQQQHLQATAPSHASTSGRSTPSNLERAVLLLEAEGGHDSHSGAATTAAALAEPRQQSFADRGAQAEASAGTAVALDAAAGMSRLRAVSTAEGAGEAVGHPADAEEGPSTPPMSSWPWRGINPASAPGSTSGAHPSCCCLLHTMVAVSPSC